MVRPAHAARKSADLRSLARSVDLPAGSVIWKSDARATAGNVLMIKRRGIVSVAR